MGVSRYGGRTGEVADSDGGSEERGEAGVVNCKEVTDTVMSVFISPMRSD